MIEIVADDNVQEMEAEEDVETEVQEALTVFPVESVTAHETEAETRKNARNVGSSKKENVNKNMKWWKRVRLKWRIFVGQFRRVWDPGKIFLE